MIKLLNVSLIILRIDATRIEMISLLSIQHWTTKAPLLLYNFLRRWNFRDSVHDRLIKCVSVKNDGLVMASVDKAMFVFSADAGCEDTAW